ncbi:MAG: DUF3054 family protein [Chloroflexi bacterium]|nr:DUF3054 family protein [Chloroflexota bacterium]
MKRMTPFVLLLGDLVALMLFIYVGQREHDVVNADNPILGLLPSVGAFALPWVVAGWWLGAFRDDALTPREFLGRTLIAWLATAFLGLLFRALLLGRAVIPTAFAIATLGFGGLFLFGWRLLFLLGWKIARSRELPVESSKAV